MGEETATPLRLALVGDYSEAVVAHRAIPKALELARAETAIDCRWDWILTRDLTDAPGRLEPYSGLWVVPASPYENTAGVLAAIRWAREGGVPFLGTCGGFQHAIIEFARNVAGIPGAEHAETCPEGANLVVTRLSCSLVEAKGEVNLAPGSRLAAAFGTTRVPAEYRCNYGFNPEHQPRMESAGLCFTARDDNGEVRGAELPGHPFFCGVLFQPERQALRGEVPAPARAWLRAAALRR